MSLTDLIMIFLMTVIFVSLIRIWEKTMYEEGENGYLSKRTRLIFNLLFSFLFSFYLHFLLIRSYFVSHFDKDGVLGKNFLHLTWDNDIQLVVLSAVCLLFSFLLIDEVFYFTNGNKIVQNLYYFIIFILGIFFIFQFTQTFLMNSYYKEKLKESTNNYFNHSETNEMVFLNYSKVNNEFKVKYFSKYVPQYTYFSYFDKKDFSFINGDSESVYDPSSQKFGVNKKEFREDIRYLLDQVFSGNIGNDYFKADSKIYKENKIEKMSISIELFVVSDNNGYNEERLRYFINKFKEKGVDKLSLKITFLTKNSSFDEKQLRKKIDTENIKTKESMTTDDDYIGNFKQALSYNGMDVDKTFYLLTNDFHELNSEFDFNSLIN